jgi:hypothetical protein
MIIITNIELGQDEINEGIIWVKYPYYERDER